MHIETVTIQKIVRLSQDAVRDAHFLNMHFTLPDGTLQEWTVPGWPGVHEGMTVTAILKKPLAQSKSNTVLGWRSHADGALAFDSLRGQHAVGVLALLAMAGMLAWTSRGSADQSMLLAIAGIFLLAAGWSVWSCWMRVKIARVLRGHAEEAQRTP